MNLKRNHLTLSHTEEHISRTLEASEDVLRCLVSQPVIAEAAELRS